MFKCYDFSELFEELIVSIKLILLNENIYIGKKRVKKVMSKIIRLAKKLGYLSSENSDIVNHFDTYLDFLIDKLRKDLMFTFDSDPAANSLSEIIIAYPGFYTTIAYRISNFFDKLNIKYIPRFLSEYAHSKTGIDIHPKAQIGDYFFIDHGTGIVIGETTIIGNHVKIYQNVTLGAISLEKGNLLKGIKRHPTIGNNVTIYAGASILGGETYIDDGTIIGSNVFITKSVSKEQVIKNDKQKKDFE